MMLEFQTVSYTKLLDAFSYKLENGWLPESGNEYLVDLLSRLTENELSVEYALINQAKPQFASITNTLQQPLKSNVVGQYNLLGLLNALSAGTELYYFVFDGHSVTSKANNDNCFSMWYPCKLRMDGISYKSAGHFILAEKARLFADAEAVQRILKGGSARAMRDYSAGIRNFDEKIWREQSFQIAAHANIAKFSQNQDLADRLYSTQDAILVDANINEKQWGIGLSETNALARKPLRWRGDNIFGFSLMQARDLL